ncbi:hypothetical protein ACJ6WE_30045 [Streptomyces sp. MMS24-I31]
MSAGPGANSAVTPPEAAVTSPEATLWRTQRRLSGHLSAVTAVDPGPAPHVLVTGGYDGHVIRWDTATQEIVWAERFADLVNAVAVDPSGSRVAVAVADGFAYVLDLACGMVLERLGPHGDDVNDVSWDPRDANVLAAVCDANDTGVYFWRHGSGDPPTVLEGHKHGVFAVAHSPSGRYLATASEDLTVRVWETSDLRSCQVLPHPGDVETLAWSPDERLLATGCDDGRLRLWSSAGWDVARTMPEAGASVRKVGFSPSGLMAFGASYDGAVRIYDMSAMSLRATVRHALQWERSCALLDDDTLVTGSFGGRAILRTVSDADADAGCAGDDVPAGPASNDEETHSINVLATGQEGRVYAGQDCGAVGVLGSPPSHRLPTLVCALSRLDSRDALIAGDYLGRITIVPDAGEPRLLARSPGGPVNALVALPDGTVVSGGYDGVLRRWTWEGEEAERVTAHHGPVKSLAWCPSSALLVAGSSDNTLSAWEPAGVLTEAARYGAEDLVLVNSVAAAVTRPWVAVASRDRHVRIWNPSGGTLLKFPAVHSKSVKAVAVSPAGDVLASGSYDSTVCLWYVGPAGDLLGWRQLIWHAKPGVSSVQSLAEGFVSAGWDGTAAFWSSQGALLRAHIPARSPQEERYEDPPAGSVGGLR